MSDYIVDTEPSATPPMSRKAKLHETARSARRKLTTKSGWFGTFDYKWLCMPVLPWGNNRKHRRPSPFYGLEDDLPILIQLVTGLQHSLAMLGGLIVPPTIFANYLALPASTQSYLISAALISSGILSMIQMSRIHLFRNYYLGTGMITVVGASFATISPAFTLFDKMYASGKCPSTTAADGTLVKGACPDAYGALIGTMMLCSLWEMGLSFVPARQLKKIFPPVITGTAIV
jgi:xanthine/uracil permease